MSVGPNSPVTDRPSRIQSNGGSAATSSTSLERAHDRTGWRDAPSSPSTVRSSSHRRTASTGRRSIRGSHRAATFLLNGSPAHRGRPRRAGGRDQPQGLVFPLPTGKYWRSSNFQRNVLKRAYLAAGWRDASGQGRGPGTACGRCSARPRCSPGSTTPPACPAWRATPATASRSTGTLGLLRHPRPRPHHNRVTALAETRGPGAVTHGDRRPAHPRKTADFVGGPPGWPCCGGIHAATCNCLCTSVTPARHHLHRGSGTFRPTTDLANHSGTSTPHSVSNRRRRPSSWTRPPQPLTCANTTAQ